MAEIIRIKDIKDPVIVFDRFRGAYWKSEGKGYTMCSRLAGIWESLDAPKGNADRKIDLEMVPDDHIRHTEDALLDARARIAELETTLAEARKDTERLDWLSQWKEPNEYWELKTKAEPLTVWLQSGCWSSDKEKAPKSLREVIDETKDKKKK
jgi:hypothetical protein